MLKVMAPLRVQVGKKWFVLNLNQYRNTHFHVLNKAKILYKEAIQSQVDALSNVDKVIIHYMLFPKDKRLCDLDNVLAIHAKFFQDALTESGKIKDDNYMYVIGSTFELGKIDKLNPHVQIIIEPYRGIYGRK